MKCENISAHLDKWEKHQKGSRHWRRSLKCSLCSLGSLENDVYSFWLLLWWDTFFQSWFWNPNTPHNLSAKGFSLYHPRFSLSLSLSRLLMNTIAQAASCCRHFVADHGAERPAAFYCLIVHFMVHIAHSPFVSRPLVHLLFLFNPFLYKP